MSADDEEPPWMQTLQKLGEPELEKSGVSYEIWSHGKPLSRTDTEAVSLDAIRSVGNGETEARNMGDQSTEAMVQAMNRSLGKALEDAFGEQEVMLVDADLYETMETHLPEEEDVQAANTVGESEDLLGLATYEDDRWLRDYALKPATEENLDAFEEAAYDRGVDISGARGDLSAELSCKNVVVPYSNETGDMPERQGVSVFTGLTSMFAEAAIRDEATVDPHYEIEETEDGYRAVVDLSAAHTDPEVVLEEDRLEFYDDEGPIGAAPIEGLDPEESSYEMTGKNGVYEVEVEC